MEEGQAVPFIMIDETINGEEVDYKFEIHPKAREIFLSDMVKNKKVAIAAIAGPQRTGKSFLSNRLLRRMKGFAIGPTTMPCTKGLWIWGEPIRINDDTVLIIMDTEGLNSVQRDVNVDLKIFSLSILLSSVFIYNSIGHIDEKALENMSYVLRISQNIRISSDNDSDHQMSKYFPFFYWVLRDFTLDLKGMSQNQYLDSSLKPVSKDEKDPRNQIRAKIRKLFSHRKCQCFPRPIHEENKLAHIQELNYNELRDGFKQKMKEFEKTFYSNLPVKIISGRPITGQVYFNLCYEYINAMNNGKVPKIMNSLESVISSEVRKVCESYQASYKKAMDELMKEEKLPLDESEIEKNYKHFLSLINEKFDQKFKHWSDIKVVQSSKAKLNEWIENDFKARLSRNSKVSEIQCMKHLMKIFDDVELPPLKSSEQITSNVVVDKMKQFNHRFQEYFQKQKAPKKYTVFAQKYPKNMTDYFSKLLSRVKGVYSQQINELRKQINSRRNQIDSVKRVMKQQDSLVDEKRRQTQSLNYQKQQLSKKLKRLEEMNELREKTEKSSKSDIKKMLQNYKNQNSQLQQELDKKDDIIEKLKAESNRQKSKREITTKFIEDQRGTREEQNLPNELVTALQGLKHKLNIMNDFYQQKSLDETVEESMKRQLDEITTDKFQSIEKAGDVWKVKLEELKKKNQKKKEQYERNIDLMSRHLEDIKNQNIELERKLTENPTGGDNRLKGLVGEKKKLEQSLRQKQNTLNSQIALNKTKQKQIDQVKNEIYELQAQMAQISTQNAGYKSFKETFSFVLRESFNWILKKPNRLHHSVRTLDTTEFDLVKQAFKQVGLNPF